MRARRALLLAAALAATATPGSGVAVAQTSGVFEGPVPRAACGPGSAPEPGLQGEVPIGDRESGRSNDGYRCNMELVGNFAGEGAEWQMAYFKHCAYYDTILGGGQQFNGTIVVDASNPAAPKMAGNLTTPAMLDPWESLKVNERRGLLGGVASWSTTGAFFLDLYDVNDDCAKPRLVSSTPVNALGHEGNFAPDGKTYYATSTRPGTLTAIDISEPNAPVRLTTIPVPLVVHGLSLSEDGNRLYLTNINNEQATTGMRILDVSEVQARAPVPQIRTVSTIGWSDGQTGQMTIPISVKGHPYVVHVDELGNGGPRIIDISDETKPKVVSKLKIEIQMPEHSDRAGESAGYGNGDGRFGTFAYNTHYCGVDREVDPTVLGCSTFEAGIRIFDIRDPLRPREIAYFNPGGNGGAAAPGSARSGGTSSYTSSAVRFVPERGEVWFTDQDKGFFVTRFTNGVWPFREATRAGASTASRPAAPKLRCGTRAVRLTIPGRRVRSYVVRVNGRRVRAKGRRSVLLRIPRGSDSFVRITSRLRSGRSVSRTWRYRRSC